MKQPLLSMNTYCAGSAQLGRSQTGAHNTKCCPITCVIWIASRNSDNQSKSSQSVLGQRQGGRPKQRLEGKLWNGVHKSHESRYRKSSFQRRVDGQICLYPSRSECQCFVYYLSGPTYARKTSRIIAQVKKCSRCVPLGGRKCEAMDLFEF